MRTCEFAEFNPRSARALSGFFNRVPRFLLDTYSPEMESLIRQAVRNTRFDLVIASQLSMATYFEAFRGIPAVMEEAELAMYQPVEDKTLGSLGAFRRQLTWTKHRRYLGDLLKNFRLCTVASEPERILVAEAALSTIPIHVIPNFVDAEHYRPMAETRAANTLVFTGSLKFSPNHDAVSWFVEEIFPLVQSKVPEVQLTVTGDTGNVAKREAPGVIYSGRVDDVRTVMAASAVSVVPIRQGGGTRLKILEALAMGTPLVTTSKGVEGIEARHGEHVLIADTAAAFAEATVRLLRDPVYAQQLADAGRRLVQSAYDSGSVLPSFLRLLEEAACPAAAEALVG
ncbi:MAG: glycosyltransferase [Acidobacteriota bacterium]